MVNGGHTKKVAVVWNVVKQTRNIYNPGEPIIVFIMRKPVRKGLFMALRATITTGASAKSVPQKNVKETIKSIGKRGAA